MTGVFQHFPYWDAAEIFFAQRRRQPCSGRWPAPTLFFGPDVHEKKDADKGRRFPCVLNVIIRFCLTTNLKINMMIFHNVITVKFEGFSRGRPPAAFSQPESTLGEWLFSTLASHKYQFGLLTLVSFYLISIDSECMSIYQAIYWEYSS